MTYSFLFTLILTNYTNYYKFYISVSLMQNYKIQIMNECLFKVETKISTVEMVPFLPIMLPTELKVCFRNSFSWGPHTKDVIHLGGGALCHEALSNSETKEPQIFELTQLRLTIRGTQNCC